MSDRILHCWAGHLDSLGFGSEAWLDEAVRQIERDGWDVPFRDGTCLLAAGHAGPHEFTPDDEIVVRFS